jgi:hypothetical protein
MDMQAILAEAHETLRRTAHLCPSGIQERDLTAEIAAETERRRAVERDDRVRQIVTEMLAAEREFLMQVVGEALGEYCQPIWDDLQQLKSVAEAVKNGEAIPLKGRKQSGA